MLSRITLLVVLLSLFTYITAQAQVKGGGSTLAGPVTDFIAKLYTEINTKQHTITYDAVGSVKALQNLVSRKYQYVASDVTFEQSVYDQFPDIQMVPLMSSPIVFIYHFPEQEYNITNLVLDRATSVAIFDGSINKWNDEKIAALNPGVTLPAKDIVRIVRSDSSGVSDIVTHAFSEFSESWKTSVGASPTPNWPSNVAVTKVSGSQGVSKAVFSTPYSISYMSLANAKSSLHNFAAMKNKAGTLVYASVASALSAMDDFKDKFNTRFTEHIVDGPGINTWPVTGFTYIAYRATNMTDCAKANALQQYLKWLFEIKIFETKTTANELIQENFFAPNLPAVNKIVLKKIYEMKCNGQLLDLGLKPLKTGAIGFGFFVLLCFVVIVIAAVIWFIKFKLSEIIENKLLK